MHRGKILLEQIWFLRKFSGFSFCLSEQIPEIFLCLIFYPLTGVSIVLRALCSYALLWKWKLSQSFIQRNHIVFSRVIKEEM